MKAATERIRIILTAKDGQYIEGAMILLAALFDELCGWFGGLDKRLKDLEERVGAMSLIVIDNEKARVAALEHPNPKKDCYSCKHGENGDITAEPCVSCSERYNNRCEPKPMAVGDDVPSMNTVELIDEVRDLRKQRDEFQKKVGELEKEKEAIASYARGLKSDYEKLKNEK